MKLLSPVLFYISLTTRPIFLGPLCVALLHNWDFLPWLLRKRFCCWTDWVFFWEDHAFSYNFFVAIIMCSSAPQLRCSTLVTKTERYCCWTDWVLFWEDHAFSYKHGCLFHSTFSLFFYRLVIDQALVFFHISLTTRLIFLGPLCVALLHNWDILPWLLRQRDCWWTSLVFFWEDHAFSYKHGCLIPSTLSLMFFLAVSL